MNELVKVETRQIDGIDRMTVRATELHAFLEVGRFFSNWIKGRIQKYGFIEGLDYVTKLELPDPADQVGHGGDRRSTEFILTLDMAKELAMVENNDKGRAARRYFIECERMLLENPPIRVDQGTLPMGMPIENVPMQTKELIVGAVINGMKGAFRHMLADLKEHFFVVFDRQHTDIKALQRQVTENHEEMLEQHRLVFQTTRSALTEVRKLQIAQESPAATAPGRPSAITLTEQSMTEVGGVYRIAGIPDNMPKRGKLSGDISRSLDAYCKRHGYPIRSAPVGTKEVSFWPEAGVTAWLAAEGNAMIKAHIDRNSPSATVTPLRVIEPTEGATK